MARVPQWKQLLEIARARVSRPHGWKKGEFGDWYSEEGAVCAMGAMKYAARKLPHRTSVYNRAIDALRACVPGEGRARGTIASFNDHPDTKKRDIIALFDCAIKEEGVKQ